MKPNFPLMKNNISKSDLAKVISYLKKEDPVLTQSKNTLYFEKLWSKWLGVKYSVFVNSGSSANLLSIALLKIKFPKGGEVIVPPLTWSSDISSLLHYGFKPVFVDINLNNLAMNENLILRKINKKTKAIFLTYVQGFNALTYNLLKIIKNKKIMLIEDVCESHGAKFDGKKLGSFGWTSNFSFYYAHHMSTIEGGMVCTSCNETYQNLRMLRSHGMLREVNDEKYKFQEIKKHKFLNKDFIFKLAGYNFRNNEIGALIGINQLKKLDENIKKRNSNHQYFLSLLNNDYFYTEFDLKGSSNYAFNLVLKNKDRNLMSRLIKKLKDNKIEFRVGSAGGGNQLRQPYLKKFIKNISLSNFKNTEHIHFYAMYIGNYPGLSKKNISKIVKVINSSIFV